MPPIADNPHPREHQHESFVDFITRRGSAQPAAHPNRPNVDVRDTGAAYAVDIEVPGLKNVQDVQCRWTSNRTLIVAGTVLRPTLNEEEAVDGSGGMSGASLYMLLGERKIGPFRRVFTFPEPVEVDKLNAWLEAGLLSLRVPKQGHTPLKDKGLVRIESRDV